MNLKTVDIPGLFVTATGTGMGKTLIASAIARTLHLQGRCVAVLKPVASGCAQAREGLISEDSEMLAAASDTHHPLDLICPNRFVAPLAPSVAARLEGRSIDYDAVNRSVSIMSKNADCMIVEGVGGVLVPMDEHHSIRDVMVAMRLPAIVVASAGLGTINHTLMTIESLRFAKIAVAGVVINQYPVENAGVAEETNPREIERISHVPVVCIVPDEPFVPPHIGPGVMAAVKTVDWESLMQTSRIRRP